MKQRLSVQVNGRSHELDVQPGATLAEVLRDELMLTGTKVGCDAASCGSCTVLVEGRAVKACSVLAVQVHGKSVTTIEGVADDDRLHPVQEAFIQNHGLQCGFCTPGFILASKALLEEGGEISEAQIRAGLGGHICRCGSYPNIVKSVLGAAKAMRGA